MRVKIIVMVVYVHTRAIHRLDGIVREDVRVVIRVVDDGSYWRVALILVREFRVGMGLIV